jgi:8-amino-7-oxononanoate synthase
MFLGSEENALAASRRLERAGVFAPAIRPPTVPHGACRIRFSLTADHTQEDIQKVFDAIQPLRRRKTPHV